MAMCAINARETIDACASVIWSAMSSGTYARTDRDSTHCPGSLMHVRSPLRSSASLLRSESRSPRECTDLMHSDLEAYQGLFWRRPGLGMIVTATLVSLAGIPLTAGFMGKVFVLLAGI